MLYAQQTSSGRAEVTASREVADGFDPKKISRVAFVTPPSTRPICRDYFCTSSSKGSYYWHPIDLWIQGARLQHTHETRLFEGVGASPSALLKNIARFAPDLIVILIGGYCLEDDLQFAKALYATTRAPQVVGGESVFRGAAFWRNQNGVLALMNGFAGDGLRQVLLGGDWGLGFLNLSQSNAQITAKLPDKLAWGKPPTWPIANYRYPLLGHPFATVLTSYGCPFLCDYCNNNRNILGLGLRQFSDLFFELDVWAERGVHWLHFRDVNFGGPKDRAVQILEEMIKRRYRFRWNAFIRPELIDSAFAELLKAAGCVQVQMGVESANAQVLKNVSRHGNLDRVKSAFVELRRRKIRCGAHFVLGLPGETEADARATIDLAIALRPDYASFNVGVSRGGTKFDTKLTPGDCSNPHPGNVLGNIAGERVLTLQNEAVRRFYSRPQFWAQTLSTMVESPSLIPGIINDGLNLYRR